MTTSNTELPIEQRSGTIFTRRPRGKKLQFIIGGPSFVEAAKFINWQGVAQMGNVVVWIGEDNVQRVVAVPTFAEQARMKFDSYVARKHSNIDAIRITAQDLGKSPMDVAEAVGLTNEFIKHNSSWC